MAYTYGGKPSPPGSVVAPALQVVRICSLHPVFLSDDTFDISFLHGPATEAVHLGPSGHPWTRYTNALFPQFTSDPGTAIALIAAVIYSVNINQ